jgi:hypothetical protein
MKQTKLNPTQLNTTHYNSTRLGKGNPHTPLRPLVCPPARPLLFTEYSADSRAAGSPWGMGHRGMDKGVGG